MKEQKECSNNNKKIVGADASTVYADSVTDKCPNRLMYVCPLLDRNTQNGITLIALIITIIVLLILAMVSIKLVWDGGIITHARTAVDKYKQAEQNEIDQINNIFGNNENQNNVPEDLEKYLLGKTLMDVMDMDNITFLDDSESIIDASTSVNYLNMAQYGIDAYIYFKYGDAAYKLVCDVENYENKSVSLVYTPDKEKLEGTTVKYSYDGTKEHEEDWIILYNNGDNLEIVSPNTMGELTLGRNDKQAQGDTDIEKAIYSYNNEVTRINKYCSELVTNTNKIAVRSVGSNPSNPTSENSAMYTSEKIAKWKVDYNGRGKAGDTNFEQDLVRMSYWGVVKSSDECSYWLASRLVLENSDYVDFYVGEVRSEDDIYSNDDLGYLWRVDSSGYVLSCGPSKAVRPVVKINS